MRTFVTAFSPKYGFHGILYVNRVCYLSRSSVLVSARGNAIAILSVCLSVTLVIHALTVQYIEMCCAPNHRVMFLVLGRISQSRVWVRRKRGR